MELISKRIRKLRMKKGLSLKAAASLIGVPVSTYKEWEYGRAIQGEPYVKMAQCFGVTLGELISGRTPEARWISMAAELEKIRSGVDSLGKELLSLG